MTAKTTQISSCLGQCPSRPKAVPFTHRDTPTRVLAALAWHGLQYEKQNLQEVFEKDAVAA